MQEFRGPGPIGENDHGDEARADKQAAEQSEPAREVGNRRLEIRRPGTFFMISRGLTGGQQENERDQNAGYADDEENDLPGMKPAEIDKGCCTRR